jgi:hypothetical protein
MRLSALRAGRPLTPGKFLVLISVKGLVKLQCHSAAGRIKSIEKSNDLIGNRTRDITACSRVSLPYFEVERQNRRQRVQGYQLIIL